MKTALRVETRLKPGCRGHEVAALKNPFGNVKLIPSTFSDLAGLSIPSQFIADSVRIGGLQRALLPLSTVQRKALKKAYEKAASLLPPTDALWANWSQTLIGYGLGQHLGATSNWTATPQSCRWLQRKRTFSRDQRMSDRIWLDLELPKRMQGGRRSLENSGASNQKDSWCRGREAAKLLAVTVRTLRRWHEEGQGPTWYFSGGRDFIHCLTFWSI